MIINITIIIIIFIPVIFHYHYQCYPYRTHLSWCMESLTYELPGLQDTLNIIARHYLTKTLYEGMAFFSVLISSLLSTRESVCRGSLCCSFTTF